MTENLTNYRKLSSPPKEAVVPIKGGAKGAAKLSSIKAQWRIEALTEVFGEYGVGWYFEEVECVPYPIPEAGVTEIFATVELYVKNPETGEWREPAVGKGQAHLVSQTKSGLFVDDEARKKAITDAFGNAAKYFGVGADIYMGRPAEEDNKYAAPTPRQMEAVQPTRKVQPIKPKLKDDETITAEQAAHVEQVLDKNHKGIPNMLGYLNGREGRLENPIEDLNQLTYKEYTEVVNMFWE